jgi:hypothetical protein
MTLSQQVCSLELAKRLKELGIQKIESLYCFILESDGTWTLTTQDDRERRSFYIRDEWCSAFTVAELGELLPTEYHSYRVGQIWFCVTYLGRMMKYIKSANSGTEADARATMLIHLMENKLL